ncbi:MAG: DUF1624 domain-containing protein [Promethearchaeota archaeon]|nr:MAG: DUF1624 domain-containing protein [Candidatus Lokiarchaeota archaeon]
MENQNDKIGDPYKKKDRIKSFDIFKGIAIFWIVIGHIAHYWLIVSSIWIYEFLLTFIFRCITGLNFIFLLGVNLSISYYSKKDSGWTTRQIWSHNLKRIGVLLIISIIYNIIIETIIGTFDWTKIFSWYILQLIIFGLIVLLLLHKLNIILKVLLAIIIILISYPLQYYLNSIGGWGSILWRILFYPPEQYPIFPWLAAPLIGAAIGEIFYKVRYKDFESSSFFNNFKGLIKKLIIIGIFCVIIGVVFGFRYPINSAFEHYWFELGEIHAENLQTNYFFTGITNIPCFLLEGHWTSFFYGIGVILICLGVLTYYCDLKNHKNWVFNAFAFAGMFSLSIFIYHHIGILWFIHMFNFIWIFPTVISFTIGFIALIWIVVKKFKAVGTIEWLFFIITNRYKLKKKET